MNDGNIFVREDADGRCQVRKSWTSGTYGRDEQGRVFLLIDAGTHVDTPGTKIAIARMDDDDDEGLQFELVDSSVIRRSTCLGSQVDAEVVPAESALATMSKYDRRSQTKALKSTATLKPSKTELAAGVAVTLDKSGSSPTATLFPNCANPKCNENLMSDLKHYRVAPNAAIFCQNCWDGGFKHHDKYRDVPVPPAHSFLENFMQEERRLKAEKTEDEQDAAPRVGGRFPKRWGAMSKLHEEQDGYLLFRLQESEKFHLGRELKVEPLLRVDPVKGTFAFCARKYKMNGTGGDKEWEAERDFFAREVENNQTSHSALIGVIASNETIDGIPSILTTAVISATQGLPAGCSFQKALGFFLSGFNGLQWLHQKGYVHRDLKPANMGIDAKNYPTDLVCKLMDFGHAAKYTDGGDFCWTSLADAPSVSPEQTQKWMADILNLQLGPNPHPTSVFPFYALVQELVKEQISTPQRRDYWGLGVSYFTIAVFHFARHLKVIQDIEKLLQNDHPFKGFGVEYALPYWERHGDKFRLPDPVELVDPTTNTKQETNNPPPEDVEGALGIENGDANAVIAKEDEDDMLGNFKSGSDSSLGPQKSMKKVQRAAVAQKIPTHGGASDKSSAPASSPDTTSSSGFPASSSNSTGTGAGSSSTTTAGGHKAELLSAAPAGNPGSFFDDKDKQEQFGGAKKSAASKKTLGRQPKILPAGNADQDKQPDYATYPLQYPSAGGINIGQPEAKVRPSRSEGLLLAARSGRAGKKPAVDLGLDALDHLNDLGEDTNTQSQNPGPSGKGKKRNAAAESQVSSKPKAFILKARKSNDGSASSTSESAASPDLLDDSNRDSDSLFFGSSSALANSGSSNSKVDPKLKHADKPSAAQNPQVLLGAPPRSAASSSSTSVSGKKPQLLSGPVSGSASSSSSADVSRPPNTGGTSKIMDTGDQGSKAEEREDSEERKRKKQEAKAEREKLVQQESKKIEETRANILAQHGLLLRVFSGHAKDLDKRKKLPNHVANYLLFILEQLQSEHDRLGNARAQENAAFQEFPRAVVNGDKDDKDAEDVATVINSLLSIHPARRGKGAKQVDSQRSSGRKPSDIGDKVDDRKKASF
ncbi:unnamed protein product [Amoebophrya sp. A120]|nr:unnamed protein product [Amoebophrya sp. A120]|eukprot:GSA120T00025368001.1